MVGRCLGAAVNEPIANRRAVPWCRRDAQNETAGASPCPTRFYALEESISRSQSEHFTHRRWISSAKSGFHPTPPDFIAPSALRCRRNAQNKTAGASPCPTYSSFLIPHFSFINDIFAPIVGRCLGAAVNEPTAPVGRCLGAAATTKSQLCNYSSTASGPPSLAREGFLYCALLI